jgi:DNA-binding GntR family transcriptional regulator
VTVPGRKKQREVPRPSGDHQSTLERFQAVIRRVAAKDDDRSSLVTDIACVVGAEILEGIRRPGSDLNSVELARRFRTSRTPTREAVVILEKEGLVEILPRRRPRVANLSIAEIREIYRVRAAMLGLIAAEVVRLATDAEIAELRAILRGMEQAAAAGDRDGYYWGNVSFHERFADMAHNKTLQRILETLVLRSLRLRRLTLTQPERMARSLADHIRLVGALEDRDAELASALIKGNVLGALKLLEGLLADGEAKR